MSCHVCLLSTTRGLVHSASSDYPDDWMTTNITAKYSLPTMSALMYRQTTVFTE
jgi:hypothetical protein